MNRAAAVFEESPSLREGLGKMLRLFRVDPGSVLLVNVAYTGGDDAAGPWCGVEFVARSRKSDGVVKPVLFYGFEPDESGSWEFRKY